MKKREQVKIRKPVAKKATRVILSKKDKMKRRRMKHRNLIKQTYTLDGI